MYVRNVNVTPALLVQQARRAVADYEQLAFAKRGSEDPAAAMLCNTLNSLIELCRAVS